MAGGNADPFGMTSKKMQTRVKKMLLLRQGKCRPLRDDKQKNGGEGEENAVANKRAGAAA
jgi:hypothetical protein